MRTDAPTPADDATPAALSPRAALERLLELAWEESRSIVARDVEALNLILEEREMIVSSISIASVQGEVSLLRELDEQRRENLRRAEREREAIRRDLSLLSKVTVRPARPDSMIDRTA